MRITFQTVILGIILILTQACSSRGPAAQPVAQSPQPYQCDENLARTTNAGSDEETTQTATAESGNSTDTQQVECIAAVDGENAEPLPRDDIDPEPEDSGHHHSSVYIHIPAELVVDVVYHMFRAIKKLVH